MRKLTLAVVLPSKYCSLPLIPRPESIAFHPDNSPREISPWHVALPTQSVMSLSSCSSCVKKLSELSTKEANTKPDTSSSSTISRKTRLLYSIDLLFLLFFSSRFSYESGLLIHDLTQHSKLFLLVERILLWIFRLKCLHFGGWHRWRCYIIPLG